MARIKEGWKYEFNVDLTFFGGSILKGDIVRCLSVNMGRDEYDLMVWKVHFLLPSGITRRFRYYNIDKVGDLNYCIDEISRHKLGKFYL